MSLYEETKFIMKQYNIVANKRLGQNFLVDENVVNNIVTSSNVTKEDLVIEIGPGLGTLTKKLLEKAGKVICVELDPKMVKIIKERFNLYDNFEVINEDVLKIDLNKIIQGNMIDGITNAKVVANLPYYITTPIIMKLLEEKLNISSITVMVQKEVAERLAAFPGDKLTGSITYTVWYYTEPQIMFEVPRDSFIPEPEVTSSVIKFKILNKPRIEVEDEEKFFRLIKKAFMQKRKTLVNALVNGGIFNSREELEMILQQLGIDTRIRGENLSLEDYKKIADKM